MTPFVSARVTAGSPYCGVDPDCAVWGAGCSVLAPVGNLLGGLGSPLGSLLGRFPLAFGGQLCCLLPGAARPAWSPPPGRRWSHRRPTTHALAHGSAPSPGAFPGSPGPAGRCCGGLSEQRLGALPTSRSWARDARGPTGVVSPNARRGGRCAPCRCSSPDALAVWGLRPRPGRTTTPSAPIVTGHGVHRRAGAGIGVARAVAGSDGLRGVD
jgi:hypothetical protein